MIEIGSFYNHNSSIHTRDDLGIRIVTVTPFVNNIKKYWGTNKNKEIRLKPWDKDMHINNV